MSEQTEVLRLVSEKLETAGVPYMLTGSMALNYYATPRMTRDLDFIIAVLPRDVAQLEKAFSAEFEFDTEMATEAVESQGMFNIFHKASLMKIDFVIRKNEAYRQMEFGRRKKVNAGGFSMWIVSLEDLIISKLYWAKDTLSEFQFRDIRALLSGGHSVDETYMKEWISQLNLQQVYEKVKNG